MYYASMFLSSKMNNFCSRHILKIHNFQAKNTFEPKAPKCVKNMTFTNFKLCCAFNDHYEGPLQFLEEMVHN